MKKMGAIFKITLLNVLQYKARSFVYFYTDVLISFVMIFFWHKAFQTQPIIGGKTEAELIGYYFFSGIAVTLVQAHPEFGIAYEINKGELSSFLLKPFSHSVKWLLTEIAYKIIRFTYVILLSPLWLFIAITLLKQIPTVYFSFWHLLIWTLSFLIVYFLRYLIGIAAFWNSEIGWVVGWTDFVMFLLSGITVPLYLFPTWFQTLSSWLPFTYFVYTPAIILINPVPIEGLYQIILKQLIWLLLLWTGASLLWKQGLKRYTAYGS